MDGINGKLRQTPTCARQDLLMAWVSELFSCSGQPALVAEKGKQRGA
jgi:hypothetical protein